MRRKFLASILAFCMMLTLFPMTAFAAAVSKIEATTAPLSEAKEGKVTLTITLTGDAASTGKTVYKVVDGTGENNATPPTTPTGEIASTAIGADADKEWTEYTASCEIDATDGQFVVAAYVEPKTDDENTYEVKFGAVSSAVDDNFTSTVAVDGVSLNETTLSLAEGANATLTATVTPANATTKTVTWKSSDDTIATVDSSGKVSAVKAGTATITVTTTDGNKTATCAVTVTKPTVTLTDAMVTVNSAALTYDGTEKTPAVTVKYTPAGEGAQEVTLVKDTDYTLKYQDNINASNTAKVVVTGKGNYSGTVNKTFTIGKADLTKDMINVTAPTGLKYGDEITITPTLRSPYTSAGTLTVEYYQDSTKKEAPLDAGSYTFKVTTTGGTNFNATSPALEDSTNWKFTISKGDAWTARATTQQLQEEGTYSDGDAKEITLTSLLPTAEQSNAEVQYSVQYATGSKLDTTKTTITSGKLTIAIANGDVGDDVINETVTVTVSGQKNYENGTITIPVRIVPDGATVVDITATGTGFDYGTADKSGYTMTAFGSDSSLSVTGTTTDYTVEASYFDSTGKAISPWNSATVHAGTYKVSLKVTKTEDSSVGYKDDISFTVAPKDISSATITLAADSVPYAGETVTVDVTKVTLGDTDLSTDAYDVSYSSNTGVGTATVTVTGKGDYTGTATETFTITKGTASVSPKSVTVAADATATVTVTTDGTVTATSVNTDIATVAVNDKAVTITGVANGTTTVKISTTGATNYNDLSDEEVNVTVGGSGGGSGSGGSGSGSTPTEPTDPVDPNPPSTGEDVTQTVTPDVSDGTASATVDQETADKIVSDAVDNKSENVTVKVDVPAGSDVNEVKADIPASAVADLASKTDAALTVDTPVANVTIPNETLSQLGGASGNVTVTAAVNEDNSVKVEVQANGSTVGSLNGGMKVDLPVSQPTAGTVAVLVDENGNETILPKSSLDGSEMAVLLETGSATIKFVDNAQSFADTDSHWAKNSIAFVSSRNLFQGMENNNFKADVPMNRAMLVTVLHRLESTPAAAGSSFDDVPSDSYYATAAAWAAGKGIVTGDASGFSGDRSVTREEMAVMLYRYVQTINGNKGTLGSFSGMGGASDVSSWANQAMRWAVGSGIISGDNSGNLNPGSTATRGEVSQMLMNFVKLITK